MRLLFRNGSVLDPFRYDKYFTWAKGNRAISQLNRYPPTEHQEKVIRIVVLVPDELAFDFDDH